MSARAGAAVGAAAFTNKAVDEMKHRVGALVGPVAEKMWVSTFHALLEQNYRADSIGCARATTCADSDTPPRQALRRASAVAGSP